VRILTVMGAVYNGLEGYAFSGIDILREQQLHRRLQCFRQQKFTLDGQDAAEVIVFASQLLRIVDKLKFLKSGTTP
jgi:hypothetical protein